MIGLAAAAGLAVTACGAGAPSPTSSVPPSSPTATPTSTGTDQTTSTGPLAPLTNLPAASSAAAGKPAVVVLVSGTSPEGLGSADVVYQDVATPTVRYLAVFQSKSVSAVGPVTSTRPEDAAILAVLHPVTGYNGGSTGFINILDKSAVKVASYTVHPTAYTTTATGLTASTTSLLGAVTGAQAPPPLFRYRGSDTGASTLAPSGVTRPSAVAISVPGLGTENWSFDAGANRWVLSSGGPRVEVANLVVQTVPFKTVFESRHLGISVQSARVIGGGHAQVFSAAAAGSSGGTAATGTWSKPHIGDVTNYFDASGQPMAFQPGSTWVILAPEGTSVSASG
jgi:hypothetical protein